MSKLETISHTVDIDTCISPGDAAPPGRPSLTVLVVEDDPLTRLVICFMLKDLGHNTCEADSAERAIELFAASNTINLVITDFSMKAMTGGQLIEAIRQDHPDFPVILATGDPARSAEVDALVLNKPFFKDDLDRAIAKTMGSLANRRVIP